MIRKWWYSARIALDYPSYEKLHRAENERLADKQHPFNEQSKKLEKLRARIVADSKNLKSEEYAEHNRRLHSLKSQLDEASAVFTVLTRDYKSELDEVYQEKELLLSRKRSLYEQLDSVKVRLSSAHDEKSRAYDRLNSAKSDVSGWYNKSQSGFPLYGNKGQKIPKRSIFGQSHGDLSYAKSRRDSAWSDVQSAKSRVGVLKGEKSRIGSDIGRLKSEIGFAFDRITSLKSERQEAYELRKSGRKKDSVAMDIDRFQRLISDEKEAIQRIEDLRVDYVVQEEEKAGVPELIVNVEKTKSQHADMISSFDLDAQRGARKQRHRQQWLDERGIEI